MVNKGFSLTEMITFSLNRSLTASVCSVVLCYEWILEVGSVAAVMLS